MVEINHLEFDTRLKLVWYSFFKDDVIDMYVLENQSGVLHSSLKMVCEDDEIRSLCAEFHMEYWAVKLLRILDTHSILKTDF